MKIVEQCVFRPAQVRKSDSMRKLPPQLFDGIAATKSEFDTNPTFGPGKSSRLEI